MKILSLLTVPLSGVFPGCRICSNDDCPDAIKIDSFPYSSTGDTTSASSDFTSTVCQADSNDVGVWYSFVGDGRAMTISVTDAQLDSRVSLFSGSNCDQLFCVGHNTKGFRDNSSELTFLSELGTDYRFLVSGVSGSTGTFAVSVVAYDHPLNDRCEDATPVTTFPINLSGTTTGAYPDVDSTICSVDKNAPGVWYSTVGDGEAKQFVVESTAEFKSRITLFSGRCGQMNCISSNTDPSLRVTGSFVIFLTDIGVTYHILVSSSTADVTNVGSFTLSAKSFERPPNDSCEGATEISFFPATISGTTSGAYADVDSTICQILPNARGVWYLILGNGKAIEINVGNNAEFKTIIAVFTGSCGQLNCVGSNSNASIRRRDSSMTLLTEIGVKYFVLLASSTSDVNEVGSFAINVQSFERRESDSCEGAVGVSELPTTLSGTTVGSFPDFATPICDIPIGSRGEWHALVGNGNVVVATVEPTAEFASLLAVFTGSCKQPSCLVSNSHPSSRNFSSRVEIESTDGVIYYFLVTSRVGDMTSVGTYTIVFSGQGPLAPFPVSESSFQPPGPSTPRPSIATSAPMVAVTETPTFGRENFFPPFETSFPVQLPMYPVLPTFPESQPASTAIPTRRSIVMPTIASEEPFPTLPESQPAATAVPTRGSIAIPTIASEEPSYLPQSPLPTYEPSTVADDILETDTTANAQDILIIANVVLSFWKTSISASTTSCWNVFMSLLEVFLTSITLSIFILNDVVNDDGRSQYGDNISVYLVSFVTSLLVEVVGVVVACKTLRAFNNLQTTVHQDELPNIRMPAQTAYGLFFMFGVLPMGIVAGIAMSKANWVTDAFGPVGFTGKVETLVVWMVALALLTQLSGGVYLLSASDQQLLDYASGTVRCMQAFQAICGFAYAVLVYIILSMVSGREAGGFCYLLLINTPQAVELNAETIRHVVLIMTLNAPPAIRNPNLLVFLGNYMWNQLEERYPNVVELLNRTAVEDDEEEENTSLDEAMVRKLAQALASNVVAADQIIDLPSRFRSFRDEDDDMEVEEQALTGSVDLLRQTLANEEELRRG